jgi:hypothetical protein
MLKRNVVVLTILAVVLGAGAYAWAQAEPERPTTTADTPNARRVRPDGALKERLARRRAHRRAGPRRAIHGDLIVRGKDGFQNVTFDKGEVTAHSDTSITVKRADGVEVTKAVNGETKFKASRRPARSPTAIPRWSSRRAMPRQSWHNGRATPRSGLASPIPGTSAGGLRLREVGTRYPPPEPPGGLPGSAARTAR